MTTQIWISTAVEPDRSSLEADWRYAGELDQSRESEIWRVVQTYLGLRTGRMGHQVEFYADLDPGSDGYEELFPDGFPQSPGTTGSPHFCLALRWSGPPERTFIAAEATLANLKRRPPEPHPGLRNSGVPVGMRVRAVNGELFTNM